MRTTILTTLALTVVVAMSAAQTRTSKTLDIYVVDVEGGNATLFAAPSGESVLIDAGNGGAAAARDAAGIKLQDVDQTENAQSVGSYVTFGKFRVVHMGDLTWNKEFDLMCPANRLGTADLFIVSHHGQAISNSPVLVHALQPRAAIMNNGVRKGGQPDAMKVLFSSPGLEDLWEMHFSQLSGQEYTVPGMFIANLVDDPPAAVQVAPLVVAQGQQAPPPPQHNGAAYYFKVSAQQDGSFTVTNTRNGFVKNYK